MINLKKKKKKSQLHNNPINKPETSFPVRTTRRQDLIRTSRNIALARLEFLAEYHDEGNCVVRWEIEP